MNDSIIDRSAHARLIEWGGPKLLRQMIRLFLENAGERLEQIATGLEEDSAKPIEHGAHSLKSSAANVGATVVNRLSAEMEDRASENDVDGARAVHADLLAAYDEAAAHLREIEKGLSE